MRELLDVQYQFERPFIVDSSRIADRLGLTATPLDQATTHAAELSGGGNVNGV